MPSNRGKNTTLLASMTTEGMGPCVAVLGATMSTVFETFVEKLLAPTLSPGQVVVVDNLVAHKGERVRELIEGRGCELLFLPPYSPDLNLIEEAFSKVKTLLRRAGARTREALIEDGEGVGCGDYEGHSRVLRALRIPASGPTSMTIAVAAIR